MGMPILDVTEATFDAEVLEGSRQVPVVVDFWAAWCGPCRQLTPVLEDAVRAREPDVVLAKLDTEANPRLAQAFGIQGIPDVRAFRDGKVVDQFTGAQSPAVVARFFDKLVPTEADRLAGAGDEDSLRRAVELEPGRADAAVPLARILLDRGEPDEAVAILQQVVGDFQADGLLARLRLEDAGVPDLADAFAALDAGERERAVDLLLEAIPTADGATDDVRRVVVAVLDELGVEHPAVRDARRRLAAALY